MKKIFKVLSILLIATIFSACDDNTQSDPIKVMKQFIIHMEEGDFVKAKELCVKDVRFKYLRNEESYFKDFEYKGDDDENVEIQFYEIKKLKAYASYGMRYKSKFTGKYINYLRAGVYNKNTAKFILEKYKDKWFIKYARSDKVSIEYLKDEPNQSEKF